MYIKCIPTMANNHSLYPVSLKVYLNLEISSRFALLKNISNSSTQSNTLYLYRANIAISQVKSDHLSIISQLSGAYDSRRHRRGSPKAHLSKQFPRLSRDTCQGCHFRSTALLQRCTIILRKSALKQSHEKEAVTTLNVQNHQAQVKK